MIRRICAVYFSGTGTTAKVIRRVAGTLAKELNLEGFDTFDFTPLPFRENLLVFGEGDFVIMGVPTIAGRVPNLLLPYLNTLKGEGALGAAVALYGNRNFDDCLVELQDLMENGGIKVIAGGSFVGEHSFSEVLGAGRPDEEDLGIADKMALEISKKLHSGAGYISALLPGERPYRGYYQPRDRQGNSIDIRKVKPKTDDRCIDCKLCARICPLGSIDFSDVSNVRGICMKCCACIKKCPTGAKYFDDEGYLYHKLELELGYARRSESKFYL